MSVMKTDRNARVARNAVFLYIRMAFVLLVSLYTTRVVLKVLGVDDFGLFNVVCGFVGMFGFLNTSLSNAIQRFYNFEIGKNGYESVHKVYTSAVVIQILLICIIVVALESLGLWYINNKLIVEISRLSAANWIFQFAVFQMVLTVLGVPYSAAILAYEKMDYYALVSVVDVALKLGAVIVLQFIEWDKLIFYGLFLVFLSLLNFFMYYVYAKCKIKDLKFDKKIEKSNIVSILSFSGWNVLGSFAYMLKNQGSALVLNSFFGTAINAAFGISNQVMGAIKVFSINLVTAFRPQLVESYAIGDYKRTTKMFFSMTKISYILLFIVSLPLICEMEQVLKLWLGDYPHYTISLTILSLVCMLLSNFNTPVAQVILAIGKLKRFQIVTSTLICMIIPLSWLCFKLGLNPNWIYIVSILFVLINQLATLVILHDFYPFDYVQYLMKSILPCLYVTILSPIVPFLLLMMLPQNILRLTIIFTVSIIITCLITFLMCLDNYEKRLVLKLFDSVISRLKK